MRRRGRFGVLAACTAAVLLLTACGDATDSGRGVSTSVPEVEPSYASSPFMVGEVPEGYEPVIAGRGTAQADWGSDSFGTHEPYTVLSPDGRADHPDVVVVSITGFEGYQGHLFQASNAYHLGAHETFTIDGRDAIYAPAGEGYYAPYWADLVAVRGDDLAVRVTSPKATREELVAILERVEVPSDRTTAPPVEPPDGFEVVGSLDVDAVLAYGLSMQRGGDAVPGPPSGHAAGWMHRTVGDRQQLVVVNLPGSSVDLPALRSLHGMHLGSRQFGVHDGEVDGRPAVLIQATSEPPDGFPGLEPSVERSVWAESAWGDVIVVYSIGPATPSEEEMVELAASVERTDAAGWEDFVIEMTGGPGFTTDPGRQELAHGRAGDLEWLVQHLPVGTVPAAVGSSEPGRFPGVDPCLKLSNRQRLCVHLGGAAGPRDWVGFEEWPDGAGSFAFVSTTLRAEAVRVTTADGSTGEAPLVPVPGSDALTAVVQVEGALGEPTCGEIDEVLQRLPQMRVDALDGGGEVIGCLGWGPDAHRPSDDSW